VNKFVTPTQPGKPDVSGSGAESLGVFKARADTVIARDVDVRCSGVGTIKAETVKFEVGGVKNIKSESVSVKVGGVLKAESDTFDISNGGIGIVRANQVSIKDSRAAAIVGKDVQASGLSVLLLAARRVTGEAQVFIDMRSAAVFGLVAGCVIGLVSFLRRRTRRT